MKNKPTLDETLMSELFGVDYPRITLPERTRAIHEKSDNIKKIQSKKTYNELFMDLFGVNATDKIVMPIEEVKSESTAPSNADFSTHRHKEQRQQDTFSFDTHIKAYKELQQDGKRKLDIILSALGDEKARDYVKLYFASDSVKWSVKKFKLHIQSNIAKWTELRQKYGDGGFANYSESIMTNELILRTLDGVSEF